MTTPFQHVTPFPKRTKEEIERLESMTEEERRADYFKRKRKNEIRLAFMRNYPFVLLSLIMLSFLISIVLCVTL